MKALARERRLTGSSGFHLRNGEIFKFCDVDTLAALMITNRRFRELVKQDFVWGYGCISEVSKILTDFSLPRLPKHHEILDRQRRLTSSELVETGLSGGGFFDTIRVYRQIVAETSLPVLPALVEERHALNRHRCRILFDFVIVVLTFLFVVFTLFSTDRAMNKVCSGITPSDPFPWFLPDLFIILSVVLVLSLVMLDTKDVDHTLYWVVLAILCCVVGPLLLFELRSNRTFIDRLAIDPSTPIPSRARVPIKTGFLLLSVFSVTIISNIALLFQDEPHERPPHLLAIVCFSATLILFTLKAFQIIDIRWTVADLPCLLGTMVLFAVRSSKTEDSGNRVAEEAISFIVLQFFHLPLALRADGLIPLPFWLCLSPIFSVFCFAVVAMGREAFTDRKEAIKTVEEHIVQLEESAKREQAKRVKALLAVRLSENG
ncbi:hypothetical protein BLNAU_14986 [Blattamonas nauphoetae]|uniref:Uncharacterized protein n=1 Tax=Blattamonas nauphoetae TaxID=2049346 RepID=A0ABQ9XGT7_9EUKA|nr:hypothetical protein BLNAU_14986 [Blattamonas nauphoetae]